MPHAAQHMHTPGERDPSLHVTMAPRMRQGEEYVPGTGALNVQLSSEETYAGMLPPPALLRVTCNLASALLGLGGELAAVHPALSMRANASRTWSRRHLSKP